MKKRIFILLFILYTIFQIALTQTNPGIVVSIRPKAVNDLKEVLLPIILAECSNIAIPDFSVNPISASNILITYLDIPSDKVSITFQNGQIALSANEFNIHLSMLFTVHYLFGIKSTSQGSGSASNSDLSSVVTLSYVDNQLQANLGNTAATVNNLSITMSGFLGTIESWIINLFLPWLKGQVNSSVSSLLQTYAAADINALLATIPFSMELPYASVGINYALTQSPLIFTDHIAFLVNGTFYDSSYAYENPPIPGPAILPYIDYNAPEDIQIFISDYVFNSALYALYSYNGNIIVDNSYVPSQSPIKLDTDSLDILFPGLYDYYAPGNHEAQLDCGFAAPQPAIAITNEALLGNLTGSCIIQVLSSNGWDNALTLTSTISFSAQASLDNFIIYLNIVDFTFGAVKISDSNIEGIDENDVTEAFNNIAMLFIPEIQETILSNGIPLPNIPFLDLTSTKVTLYPGYIKIGATPEFKPIVMTNIIKEDHERRRQEYNAEQ